MRAISDKNKSILFEEYDRRFQESDEQNDILSIEEIDMILKDVDVSLVVRDYFGMIVGTVITVSDNLNDLKRFDDTGSCDDIDEETAENSPFIAVKLPVDYTDTWRGLDGSISVVYAYGSNGGAYVSRKDNLAVLTLCDKKLYNAQF